MATSEKHQPHSTSFSARFCWAFSSLCIEETTGLENIYRAAWTLLDDLYVLWQLNNP